MQFLSWIRERYHPLWRLRQWGWYRWMQAHFDFTVARSFRNFVFFGKAFRDFSLLALPYRGEEKTCALIGHLQEAGLVTHFFDLGANIGLLTWYVLARQPSTIAYLFEPDPTNLSLLRKTIQANGWTQAKIWAGVVSDHTEARDFLLDEASGATGSIMESRMAGGPLSSAYHSTQRLTVESTTLDVYVDEIPDAAKVLVKIDVEGAEAEVLAGARNFIEKHRPIIIIECFYPENLEPLVKVGYQLRPLDKNGNYLLFPKEKAGQLKE